MYSFRSCRTDFVLNAQSTGKYPSYRFCTHFGPHPNVHIMSYLGSRSLRLDLTAARLQLLQSLRRHSQPFFERSTRSARTHRAKAWPRLSLARPVSQKGEERRTKDRRRVGGHAGLPVLRRVQRAASQPCLNAPPNVDAAYILQLQPPASDADGRIFTTTCVASFGRRPHSMSSCPRRTWAALSSRQPSRFAGTRQPSRFAGTVELSIAGPPGPSTCT